MKKPKPGKKPLHHGTPPAGILHRGVPPVTVKPRKPGALARPAPKPAPHPYHGLQPGGVMHLAKKKPAKKKRALPDGVPCVAAAVAACLGIPLAEVLPSCPDEAYIDNVLEALGVRCRPVEPADVPGLILGLALPEGDHAALSAGDGLMWSWGLLMPVYGDVEEAWALT